MKIKSLYFALLSLLYLILLPLITSPMGFLVTFPLLIFYLIPTILLIFNKTKKVGAILSIIFGVIGILIRRYLLMMSPIIILPVSLLFILAGIFYFWKKN